VHGKELEQERKTRDAEVAALEARLQEMQEVHGKELEQERKTRDAEVAALEARLQEMQEVHGKKLAQERQTWGEEIKVRDQERDRDRETLRESSAKIVALEASEKALTAKQLQMQDAALRADEARQRRKQRSLDRMAARRRRVSLLRAWNGWHKHARACKAEDSRHRILVHRVAKRSLVQAWKAWSGHASKEKRLRVKAGWVVRKMMKRSLAVAFETWITFAVQECQLRSKALKALRRWMEISLASAFGKWRHEAQRGQELKAKGLRLFQQREDMWLARAFKKWRQRTQRAISLVSQHLKIKRQLLTRTASLQNMLLFAVLQSWRDHMMRLQTEHAAGMKVTRRRRMQTCAQCLTAWYDTVADWRRLRSSAQKVSIRVHWCAHECTGEYACTLHFCRIWREDHAVCCHVCLQVLRRWFLLAISRPFDTWREHAEQSIRSQSVLLRVVQVRFVET